MKTNLPVERFSKATARANGSKVLRPSGSAKMVRLSSFGLAEISSVKRMGVSTTMKLLRRILPNDAA